MKNFLRISAELAVCAVLASCDTPEPAAPEVSVSTVTDTADTSSAETSEMPSDTDALPTDAPETSDVQTNEAGDIIIPKETQFRIMTGTDIPPEFAEYRRQEFSVGDGYPDIKIGSSRTSPPFILTAKEVDELSFVVKPMEDPNHPDTYGKFITDICYKDKLYHLEYPETTRYLEFSDEKYEQRCFGWKLSENKASYWFLIFGDELIMTENTTMDSGYVISFRCDDYGINYYKQNPRYLGAFQTLQDFADKYVVKEDYLHESGIIEISPSGEVTPTVTSFMTIEEWYLSGGMEMFNYVVSEEFHNLPIDELVETVKESRGNQELFDKLYNIDS